MQISAQKAEVLFLVFNLEVTKAWLSRSVSVSWASGEHSMALPKSVRASLRQVMLESSGHLAGRTPGFTENSQQPGDDLCGSQEPDC